MNNVSKGIVAGFAATAVLSMIMVAKGMMGLMPELNVIAMLGSMMNTTPIIGWVIHFMIGMIAWGVGFAIFLNVLPGNSHLSKGISFGVAAWILMMVMIMPMAGAGLFGLNMGMMAPAMTLMLHVIYGAILGLVFDKLGIANTATAADTADSAQTATKQTI